MNGGLMKKKILGFLSSLYLLQCLTACSIEPNSTGLESTIECDFTMLQNMSPVTSNVCVDLNEHLATPELEQATGKVVDYFSSIIGEESLSFLLMMATRELPDLLRVNLEKEYNGGVDEAIEDGMILDITSMVEEHAPHFMARLQEDESYQKSAYTDSGILSQFGATMVEEEMRGRPMYGPLVNATYLEQVGLDVPVTIADWEEMLEAFADLGIIPLSFGAKTDLSVLYDSFASAFGVTAGAGYFQENGVVKFSPLEAGYFDFVELFQKWYQNGWIHSEFYNYTQEDILTEFQAGKVGATIGHGNNTVYGANVSAKLGNEMEFLPTPYPVLKEGDVISTRHYTSDFIGDPVYIYAKAENPVEIIKWVDYFYSEDGILLSNWGTEGKTYQVTETGEKEFTEFVMNNPEGKSVISVLTENVLLDVRTVADYQYEMAFFQDPRQHLGWEVWSLANYDNVLPERMTYSLEDREEMTLSLGRLPEYVTQMTIKFIIGQEPLSNYTKFTETMLEMDGEEFLQMTQDAFDRYQQRGN